MRLRILLSLVVLATGLYSCKEDALPKPKAMLRLEYDAAETAEYQAEHYEFSLNKKARVKQNDNSSLTLEYPGMKGSIFMTYKEVEDNLDLLIADAQKLSYEHVVKADNIIEQPFVNTEDRVFGMYYEVQGNAASQAQFYVTDSLGKFVTGSLYFYARPNYDSIYPAAAYLQNDIRQIMESLRWK